MDETNPNSRIVAHLGPNALAILNRWAAAAEKSYYRAHRELTQARSREKRNEASDAQVWLKQRLEAIRTPSAAPAPSAPVQNEPKSAAPQQRKHLSRQERRRQRAMAAA